MTAEEVANELMKNPKTVVMVHQPSSNPDSIVEVTEVDLRVAEEGEFPEDWNMPEGFTFIHLT